MLNRAIMNIPDSVMSPAPLSEALGLAVVDEEGQDLADLNWFALSVKNRHEKVVRQLLTNKGFETFLPLYTRRHQYARRAREFDLPLFPGYLFCRFDPTACLPIVTTPGVLRLVGFGRTPTPLDSVEIASIQRAIEAKVSVVPHPYWRSGQKVRIGSGALAGVEGVVVGDRPTLRLVLSVTLLQRSVSLEIDASRVELMAEAHAGAHL
jgi:transcription antitermination factor NusG